MAESSERKIYLRQAQLGPMANFVYLIGDPATHKLAVVDPAWDVEAIRTYVEREGYEIDKLLLTHYHPDHLGNAAWLATRWACVVAMPQAEYLTAHAVADERGGYGVGPTSELFRRHGLAEEYIAAIEARGEAATRRKVLVPESAHGTNPATGALLGFTVRAVEAREDGTVSADAVRARLGPDVAAMMLTNPNTCGLFEPEIAEIAAALHEAGAYLYCDGANFNAIAGKVRPGDLGVDAMHINLHKTFSTPHGGGGPGAGPVVL